MSENSETLSQKDMESSVASEPVVKAEETELAPGKSTNNNLSARRGRMITAGLLATVVLAVIAILVSGIFQLTSRWLIVCPKDLPVNDPAPILWQNVVAQESKSAKLGIPEKLVSLVGFKTGMDSSGASETRK